MELAGHPKSFARKTRNPTSNTLLQTSLWLRRSGSENIAPEIELPEASGLERDYKISASVNFDPLCLPPTGRAISMDPGPFPPCIRQQC